MALPTIDELNDARVERFVFPRGNTIPYSMDFRRWEGIPSDRIFYKRREENGQCDLVADGYGANGNYGNGSIYVATKNLPLCLTD